MMKNSVKKKNLKMRSFAIVAGSVEEILIQNMERMYICKNVQRNSE